jgi:hypothetical protein
MYSRDSFPVSRQSGNSSIGRHNPRFSILMSISLEPKLYSTLAIMNAIKPRLRQFETLIYNFQMDTSPEVPT